MADEPVTEWMVSYRVEGEVTYSVKASCEEEACGLALREGGTEPLRHEPRELLEQKFVITSNATAVPWDESCNEWLEHV
jgi:hypothetical protein